MAVRVGTVLAGRYQVTEPIATGGMGEVWQARDRTLGRIIAVKVLKSEYTGDSSFLIRFRNEARHTAALSHPNIASVYDYGETTEDGQRLAYLIMEFVEGKPLVTILAERGRLTAEQTLDVLGQAGDGLSAAHAAGMVHRDIKPGNLLVRPDGVVKLTDFGIAYARDAAPLTRTGMVVGTAQYLSPEQAQGHVVTAASDVYSLGVLGYECVAGVRPFDGESQVAIALAQINRPPPPLPADVPPAVRRLIDRALSKDPAARFPDGGAFAAAVRQVAAGGAVPPPTGATQVLGPDGTATAMIPMADAATGVMPSTAPRTMPPLQGPPTGDGGKGRSPGDPWDGEDAQDPADRRRTRLLWAAGALLLLGLAVVGFIVLNSGDRSRDTGGSAALTGAPPAASSTAPVSPTGTDLVTIDPASFIGRNLDEVIDELEAEGLEVSAQEATAEQLQATGIDLEEDDVAAVEPFTDRVDRGSTITLYYATEDHTAQPEETSSAPTDGGGGGEQSSSAPTSAAGGGGGGAGVPSSSNAAPSNRPSTRPSTSPAPSGGGGASSSAPAPAPSSTTAVSTPAAPSTTASEPAVSPTPTVTESPAALGGAVGTPPAP
ncbi:serine/threonine-protein kinase [Modestobacter sp. SSW1-42]|uniref:serine/threonine-protein kinase n=1 Tax=Modestobacter sp. SSW1-42 TaxID=596372 RepID=UPI003986FF81